MILALAARGSSHVWKRISRPVGLCGQHGVGSAGFIFFMTAVLRRVYRSKGSSWAARRRCRGVVEPPARLARTDPDAQRSVHSARIARRGAPTRSPRPVPTLTCAGWAARPTSAPLCSTHRTSPCSRFSRRNQGGVHQPPGQLPVGAADVRSAGGGRPLPLTLRGDGGHARVLIRPTAP